MYLRLTPFALVAPPLRFEFDRSTQRSGVYGFKLTISGGTENNGFVLLSADKQLAALAVW